MCIRDRDAIRISEEGHVVTPELWQLWNMPGFGQHISFGERMAATEASRAIYYKPDGSGYKPGERIMNPDHARALRRPVSYTHLTLPTSDLG